MEGPKRSLPADSASDGQVVLKKQKTGSDLATASQQPGVRHTCLQMRSCTDLCTASWDRKHACRFKQPHFHMRALACRLQDAHQGFWLLLCCLEGTKGKFLV